MIVGADGTKNTDEAFDAGKVEALNVGSAAAPLPQGMAPHGLSRLPHGQLMVRECRFLESVKGNLVPEVPFGD